MKVIHDLHWVPEFADGTAVTIGEFDGVHRGHRVVLHELSQRAAVLGCPTVVVTFDRDPESVTAPADAPLHLTDIDHKLELLASTGVDIAVVLPAEFVALYPDPATGRVDDDAILGRLIDEVLIGALHTRTIIVGENFHFGERRRTTIEMLEARSAGHGFDVVKVPLSARTTRDGDVISSMSIRQALRAGDVRLAQKLLGRPYELRSNVSIGDRRGRSIGFPTANLPAPATMQLPCDGVYAGWFTDGSGTRHAAAVNIGRRPTFYENSHESLVEAHLLGFKGDLYGTSARLSFISHLRDERKFNGIDELVGQLKMDIQQTARVLAQAS
jgi:riboflavin kinase/FMN adenylyltransferase